MKVRTAASSDTRGDWYGGLTVGYHRRRTKTDWAGVGLGDAFRANLEYFLRINAQRTFYGLCRRTQLAAVRLCAGGPLDGGFQPRVKAQLGPCYANYPATLGAYAAIGLTAFLEFQAAAGGSVLETHLQDYLKNPAAVDRVAADPEVYQRVARAVTRAVQNRLLLQDLSRAEGLAAVEVYRLFAASQQNLRLGSVPELIDTVVLYGDVLPDWATLKLHPLTGQMLEALDQVSQPFLAQLSQPARHDLVTLGMRWVRGLCKALASYLPAPGGETVRQEHEGPAGGRRGGMLGRPRPAAPTDRVPPLDAPAPPTLFGPPSAAERAAGSLGAGAEGHEAATKALQEFAQALDQAGGQQAKWEDMRSDLLERAMMTGAFGETPIQGTPAEGHEITIRLGRDETAGGDIHDRPVPLSDDLPACERLRGEARPLTDVLRRTLYPNLEERLQVERLHTSGALDPARLSLADYSAAVFRRYRREDVADRRGQPLLVLACDGSGSLNALQMRMLKVLTAAWLASTARTRIQVMAGLYHSGTSAGGPSGPLVEWVYHPQKSPCSSRWEAVRAVASLADNGTGVQSDALSLAFMLEEAKRLARGRMVYLVVMTDCQWNRSFSTPRSGAEEVRVVLEQAYTDLADSLHVTLVALGVGGDTGFEDLVQKVIRVPASELQDYTGLAAKIGVYVAGCMRERRRFLAQGRRR